MEEDSKFPIFFALQFVFGIALVVVAIIGLFFYSGPVLWATLPILLGCFLICGALNTFTTGMGGKLTARISLGVGIAAIILGIVFVIIAIGYNDTPQEIS